MKRRGGVRIKGRRERIERERVSVRALSNLVVSTVSRLKAAFSKSVSWISSGRNSTLHPGPKVCISFSSSALRLSLSATCGDSDGDSDDGDSDDSNDDSDDSDDSDII